MVLDCICAIVFAVDGSSSMAGMFYGSFTLNRYQPGRLVTPSAGTWSPSITRSPPVAAITPSRPDHRCKCIAMRWKHVSFRASSQNDGNSLRCDGSKGGLGYRAGALFLWLELVVVSGAGAEACQKNREFQSFMQKDGNSLRCEGKETKKGEFQSFIAKRWKFNAMR